ncbi:MBL fold metallo-hydrolase [Sesbania bispinosa]|nr:MBL fold metallo-hydrolase [Sesbania bispinosa]
METVICETIGVKICDAIGGVKGAEILSQINKKIVRKKRDRSIIKLHTLPFFSRERIPTRVKAMRKEDSIRVKEESLRTEVCRQEGYRGASWKGIMVSQYQSIKDAKKELIPQRTQEGAKVA